MGQAEIALLAQFRAEGLQAAADELGLAHGVAAGLRPDDAQEGRDDLGDFFSRAGRPPPGRRTRSAGRSSSEAASSSRPRRMVSTCRPVMPGDGPVAAVAELGTLDGGVPAALLLIEAAEQEVHLPVESPGRDAAPGRGSRGTGTDGLPAGAWTRPSVTGCVEVHASLPETWNLFLDGP